MPPSVDIRPERCQVQVGYNFWGIETLRDGVTGQSALTEMKTIAKQLQRQYSTNGREESASVIPLSEVIVGDVRPILPTLLSGAVLLLLIACVNVPAWCWCARRTADARLP